MVVKSPLRIYKPGAAFFSRGCLPVVGWGTQPTWNDVTGYPEGAKSKLTYVARRALEISSSRALSNTAASDFIEGKKCFI